MLIPNIQTSRLSAQELQIVNAAMVFLIRTDLETVTMGQLISATDSKKSHLYQLFCSREDLYAAIILANEFERAERLSDWAGAEKSELIQNFIRFSMKNEKKALLLHRIEHFLSNLRVTDSRYNQYCALALRNKHRLTNLIFDSEESAHKIDLMMSWLTDQTDQTKQQNKQIQWDLTEFTSTCKKILDIKD